MKDDLVIRRQAGDDFGISAVAMVDAHGYDAGASVFDDEYGPIIALAEQRPDGNGKHIVGVPYGHVYRHPKVMTEQRPDLGRINEVDRNPHALFLDAKGGNLEKSRGIDSSDPSANRRAAPSVRSEERRVGKEDGRGGREGR